MAEIKISELTANGANLQATDRIPTAVDDGLGGFVTRYVTGDEVIGAVSKTTVPVRNQSGATIYKGTIVYISSAAGNKLLISKSLANSEATSARTLGVVTADIPNNSNGNVQSSGILTNLDTRSSATHPFTSVTLAEGDTLYLDPTTAGYITNVKPLAPSHLVYIGKVINASPTTGEILYQIQNGFELYEIHDVAIASVANNDVLQYDSGTSLWKNETLSNAGIQPTLVSGTSIKTINSTSILGSGDIAISSGLTVGTTAIASGTIGRILFQNSSNLLGQESNFFWDNTNKRLGIGTSTPLDKLNIYTATGNNGMVLSCSVGNANVISFKNLDATSQGSFLATGSSFNPYGTYQSSQVNLAGSAGGVGIRTTNGANSHIRFYTGNADSDFSTEKIRIASTTGNLLINTTTDSGAKLEVKAGGALSTDIAFKVRNSADTLNAFKVQGDNEVNVRANLSLGLYPAGATRKLYMVRDAETYGLDIDWAGTTSIGARVINSGGGINTALLVSSFNGTSNFAISIPNGDISISGTAGTKIGVSATQKIGFWNATPIVQPTTAVAASTFVVGVGTAVTDASTFDGYTLGQIVKALRNTGILA